MGRIKFIFGTFQARVTVILVLAMLFSGTASNLLVSKFALDAQFEQLRERLKMIAQATAMLVDAGELLRVPLNKDGRNTPEFRAIADRLNKVRELNKQIKYVYTMTKTDDPDIWQFIVDPTAPEQEKALGLSSDPGDSYDVSRFPEMRDGFNAPSADKKLVRDEWGMSLSAYAPILGADGRPVAVIGIDMAANDVYALQEKVRGRALIALLLGVVLSVLLGLFISKGITDPVKKLVDGTRNIAKNDLDYTVNVKGPSEIKELAKSLNLMSVDLRESRDKLRDYFYKVVQALVKVLEAKDTYTKGHSERVAGYSEKIAVKLGMGKDKVGFLKEAALLHDIGKLGIHEGILNKIGKLTEDEWDTIAQHPVVGEEILKPVFIDDEMLSVARRHHERHDGKGYPDRLSGGDISILAQIVSVADAYDAMTSDRAYRPAMDRKKAVEELKKHRNTQFNPEIVDIFVEILEQGGI